ncbi:MAG: 2,3-bisphosphoglycerate-independent phosphoglycerate mutase [Proteobacteria bacterium]|nr:2,3-bisphosphoglycerate-independent phosphoglycerate mutase [Pseudomonadota bacterium]MBU4471360.1 2,3-bisphosphoglycerate-independent phosphoglycerate mutase [Pseudomonadota bacterium]MCG2751637.1 2,3-bisphosphoglycerate-independent phosphoglycerate mutase [Desulfobacteraceae bacterium]
MNNQRPCLLMILDGWGIGDSGSGNAISQAKTPHIHQLMATYPGTRLECSGEAVGLPKGIMGNSEVGHLNIGAGRIVYQDLLRIDQSIKDESFFKNAALTSVMEKVKHQGSALHLMGLVSDGGVHSQLAHLFALLKMAKDKDMKRVYIHVILDGRDTPPDSGLGYTRALSDEISRMEFGKIATVCGRYYAMDRDTRWDRTEKAYRLYTEGEGVLEKNPVQAVKNAYEKGQTDEFVQPVAMVDEQNSPLGMICDHDGVIFFNYRADRARQITRALTEADFTPFERNILPQLCEYVCMTLYDEKFTLPMAFGPEYLKDILGEVISQQGLRQLRIAETEKYAHVTYFFNGGEEKPFPLEDRCLVPSPREVATYDKKPEMSAPRVTEELLAKLASDPYALVVLNFANMDMVGHTGIIEAAIQAYEVLDDCIFRITSKVLEKQGTVIITADHGNAEKMRDENNKPHTAHTLNPVPLVLVSEQYKNAVLKKGILADIAPTILQLMGIEQPAAMTGQSLIEKV